MSPDKCSRWVREVLPPHFEVGVGGSEKCSRPTSKCSEVLREAKCGLQMSSMDQHFAALPALRELLPLLRLKPKN